MIITPVGHPMAKPIIPPPDGYLQAVVDLAHKNGAVVTFDEIRTGFRVSMGGASERYGVTPDLTTVGKAMANGYSIAALVGRREILNVYVKGAFLSSTYFPNSLEMAASMKCLEVLEREKVQDAIWERGTRFLDRLGAIVDASGVPVTKSGIPPMPFLTFDHVDDQYKERRTEFYTQCIRRGLFVQPYHHWYICYRHTEADLSRALDGGGGEPRVRGAGVSFQRVICSSPGAAPPAPPRASRQPPPKDQGDEMDKLIITVAGVGAETTKEAQPALPISAQEIGEDAARCREAGAEHLPPSRAPARRHPDAGQGRLRRGGGGDPRGAPTSSSRPRPAAPWA